MGSHFIRGVLVLCLALAVGFVPAASPVDAQGKGTIKIATQSPLSGGQSAKTVTLRWAGCKPRTWNQTAAVWRLTPQSIARCTGKPG